jgi:hypothetical protein
VVVVVVAVAVAVASVAGTAASLLGPHVAWSRSARLDAQATTRGCAARIAGHCTASSREAGWRGVRSPPMKAHVGR